MNYTRQPIKGQLLREAKTSMSESIAAGSGPIVRSHAEAQITEASRTTWVGAMHSQSLDVDHHPNAISIPIENDSCGIENNPHLTSPKKGEAE
jgi:hypothetical protein